MSQMLFSHDTELTLRAACGLINSDRVEGEQLRDMAALDAFLDGYGWTGRRDHDAAELASIHRLRERLGKIWERGRGRGAGRRPGQRAAQRHQGIAVADPACRSSRNGTCTWRRCTTRSGSGWVRRWRWRWPTSSASGSCVGSRSARHPTARPYCWTCRATGRESSAIRATAATASTSPHIGNAGRKHDERVASTAMHAGQRDLDIVIYGASGFVGRLTAEYLAKAGAGIRVGLAGRSAERLLTVRQALGAGAENWPLIVAELGATRGAEPRWRLEPRW